MRVILTVLSGLVLLASVSSIEGPSDLSLTLLATLISGTIFVLSLDNLRMREALTKKVEAAESPQLYCSEPPTPFSVLANINQYANGEK